MFAVASSPPFSNLPPARVLSVPLPAGTDLARLHAALTRRGDPAVLFERADGPSLLLARAAARVELRDQAASVEALTANGAALLDRLGSELPHGRRAGDRWTAAFPRCDAPDAESRLQADSALSVLRALSTGLPIQGEAPFPPFVLGVLVFDFVDMIEPLPPASSDPLGFPDARFEAAELFVARLPDGSAHACRVVFDGDEGGAATDLAGFVASLADLRTPAARTFERVTPPEAATDLDDAAYEALVRTCKEHVAAGDVFQIVPSRTFRAPCPDPLAAFQALRAINPSPAMFYLPGEGWTLFGASPETAVRVGRDAHGLTVEVKPIAGTRRRGADAAEDAVLEAELRADAKEVAEHMMLVDLGRNDVAQVAQPGTREVTALMAVERYAHVMHLVSTVGGRLRTGLDAFHALGGCLNVGTLTGAPKIRATELLRRYERTKRGPYGGAIGWMAADGRADTAVVIRSALVRNGVAQVRAGAGVVWDSDPAAEADETRRKAASVLSAIAAAEVAA